MVATINVMLGESQQDLGREAHHPYSEAWPWIPCCSWGVWATVATVCIHQSGKHTWRNGAHLDFPTWQWSKTSWPFSSWSRKKKKVLQWPSQTHWSMLERSKTHSSWYTTKKMYRTWRLCYIKKKKKKSFNHNYHEKMKSLFHNYHTL